MIAEPEDIYFYRYRDSYYEYAYELEKWKVMKETPEGYWIYRVHELSLGNRNGSNEPIIFQTTGAKKWIKKFRQDIYIGNKFAYQKKSHALINYKRRKEKQLQILSNQTTKANAILRKLIQNEKEIYLDMPELFLQKEDVEL